MTSDPPAHPESVSRSDVARGAGLAGLARLSVGIEAVAQPLYIWLFGLASYGIYVVLWGAVNLLSNLLDLSLTTALQRVVPLQRDEWRANAAVKLALLFSMGTTTLAAALISLNAHAIAGIFSTAPEDREALPRMIAIFVWALPLWTFVEIATSAARARRAFGPEIRLRLFWEQVARILFALGVFAVGMRSSGLIVAHLASLSLTALLSLRLLARYYDLRLMWRTPIERGLARELLLSGIGLLPAELSRRALIDAPAVLLNLMLPGANGAHAAGLFEIGRKLATVPQIVRQAFQYVLGPLSSHQANVDRSVIPTLYRFSSRVSTALVVPLAGLMIFTAPDVLSVYRDEALGGDAGAHHPLLGARVRGDRRAGDLDRRDGRPPAAAHAQQLGRDRAVDRARDVAGAGAPRARHGDRSGGGDGGNELGGDDRAAHQRRGLALRPQAGAGAAGRDGGTWGDGGRRMAVRRTGALCERDDPVGGGELAHAALRPDARGPAGARRAREAAAAADVSFLFARSRLSRAA